MGKVIATFSDRSRAEHAVNDLEREGFHSKEISLVAKDDHNQAQMQHGGHTDSVSDGTAWGAGIGAGAGLLASAGLLVIPGIGPILAAGPLAAALGGAAVGGLTGAFVDWGIPSSESHHLQKEVEEGRAVVLVDSPHADKAEHILNQQHADQVKMLD